MAIFSLIFNRRILLRYIRNILDMKKKQSNRGMRLDRAYEMQLTLLFVLLQRVINIPIQGLYWYDISLCLYKWKSSK